LTESNLPNPGYAAQTLQKILAWVEPMGRAFEKANQGSNLFPFWRQLQILNFVRRVGLYARDLDESYRSDRIDSLAQALRNLMELDIWVEFCELSEENAKQFFDDMARDTREVIETHQKLYTDVNKKAYEGADDLYRSLKENAATLIVTNVEGKYTQVSDVAKKIGRNLRHSALYKIASKYAHPTSLLLLMKEPPQRIIDAFYGAGSQLAISCLASVERSILKKYPDFDV
jgi:polyhydroxyalkanoate synthesis regulator phasin